MENKEVSNLVSSLSELIKSMDLDSAVDALNHAREQLHKISPFANEPVDFVKWVKNDSVTSNDYNPNKVAPPEMKLLELSILNDGYTQPIVAWSDSDKGMTEVIDGFHRSRVDRAALVAVAALCFPFLALPSFSK